LNREEQITVVMVTHDRTAAETADRIMLIRDGEVIQTGREEPAQAEREGGDLR
jgi:putative ABC transport system ATP-binding protein